MQKQTEIDSTKDLITCTILKIYSFIREEGVLSNIFIVKSEKTSVKMTTTVNTLLLNMICLESSPSIEANMIQKKR